MADSWGPSSESEDLHLSHAGSRLDAVVARRVSAFPALAPLALRFLASQDRHGGRVFPAGTKYTPPGAEGLLQKGTDPSFTLTRKPLFFKPMFTTSFLTDRDRLSLLVETDFGQRVAVDINACFMEDKNMVSAARKEPWHRMCVFVELLLDLQ